MSKNSRAAMRVLGSSLFVLIVTACGPDNNNSDTSAKTPTSPAAATNTDRSAPDSRKSGSTKEETGVSNGHEYVCSRLKASKVSAVLGKPFKAMAPDKTKQLLPGLHTCNYLTDDMGIWLTVEYTDRSFSTYQKKAAKTDVYRSAPEIGKNVITSKGENGSDYHMLDGTHTISVYDFGTVLRGGISQDKLNELLRILPAQIN